MKSHRLAGDSLIGQFCYPESLVPHGTVRVNQNKVCFGDWLKVVMYFTVFCTTVYLLQCHKWFMKKWLCGGCNRTSLTSRNDWQCLNNMMGEKSLFGLSVFSHNQNVKKIHPLNYRSFAWISVSLPDERNHQTSRLKQKSRIVEAVVL